MNNKMNNKMNYMIKIGQAGNNQPSTRVTIPSQIVEELNLKEVTYVEVTTEGDKIILIPVRKS